jgi:PTS system nitrogen regulatory IIA component
MIERPKERSSLVDIADLLTPEHVFAVFSADDKPTLLCDLSQRAARALTIDRQVIFDALQAREALGSTGVGAGVAVPHARIPNLSRFFGLFARLERAINFEAIDGQPVDLVFFLLTPDREDNDQLAALACVTRLLRVRDTATRLRAARNTGEICKLLLPGGAPSITLAHSQ